MALLHCDYDVISGLNFDCDSIRWSEIIYLMILRHKRIAIMEGLLVSKIIEIYFTLIAIKANFPIILSRTFLSDKILSDKI